MGHDCFNRIVRGAVLMAAVAALVGLGTACQSPAGGGGGGGGGNGALGAEAAAGQLTYNQVCQDCHGTPGRNDGDAPDLEGTSAAAIEAEVTGDDHGGGRIEGFEDRHYDELAAYLNADAVDGGGGADGGDGGGGDGGTGDGGGTDVATACYFATAAEVQTTRESVQTDYANGVSREDELFMMSWGCEMNPNVAYDDCVACASAIIDEVYP